MITKNLLPSLIFFFFFQTRIKLSVKYELGGINPKRCVSPNGQHKSNSSNKRCEKNGVYVPFPECFEALNYTAGPVLPSRKLSALL